jgi:hypothetical protein
MRVWLKRKLAERIDDVDLSDYNVGDTLELSTRDASLLVAEEWAAPERRAVGPPSVPDQVEPSRADRAADHSYQRKDGRLAPQSSSRRR